MTREESLYLAKEIVQYSSIAIDDINDLLSIACKIKDYTDDIKDYIDDKICSQSLKIGDAAILNDIDKDASFEMNIQSKDTHIQSRENVHPYFNGILGKNLIISSSHNVCHNNPGYSIEFPVETVRLVFEISKDEVGYVLMTKEAWKVFLNK